VTKQAPSRLGPSLTDGAMHGRKSQILRAQWANAFDGRYELPPRSRKEIWPRRVPRQCPVSVANGARRRDGFIAQLKRDGVARLRSHHANRSIVSDLVPTELREVR
jgi:hypothetical protein